MKIGIVGNGFVGRATQIFAKNYFTRDEPGNHSERNESLSDKIKIPFFKRIFFKPITVYIYDIRPEACQPPGMTLEELDRECDLLFFCLPTPLHHDGSCYTQILEDTIAKCSNPFKIIRSTIPVGFATTRGFFPQSQKTDWPLEIAGQSVESRENQPDLAQWTRPLQKYLDSAPEAKGCSIPPNYARSPVANLANHPHGTVFPVQVSILPPRPGQKGHCSGNPRKHDAHWGNQDPGPPRQPPSRPVV